MSGALDELPRRAPELLLRVTGSKKWLSIAGTIAIAEIPLWILEGARLLGITVTPGTADKIIVTAIPFAVGVVLVRFDTDLKLGLHNLPFEITKSRPRGYED